MEAVWKIEVEDFPAFIVVDDKGNDFFTDTAQARPAHGPPPQLTVRLQTTRRAARRRGA